MSGVESSVQIIPQSRKLEKPTLRAVLFDIGETTALLRYEERFAGAAGILEMLADGASDNGYKLIPRRLPGCFSGSSAAKALPIRDDQVSPAAKNSQLDRFP